MGIVSAPIGPSANHSPLDRRWPWFGRVLDRLGILGQSLWLLYFSPSHFMPAFVMRRRFGLNALFAWTYAMAHLIDGQAIHYSRQKGSVFTGDWTEQWAFLACAGIVLGAAIYRFGGWWYEVRLWWSGVNPVDEDKARSAYLVTAQIQALPTILWAVGETLYYETPAAAMSSGSLWILPMVLLPFWSIRASYLAVRSLFDGNRIAMRLWFFFVPTVGVLIPLIVGGIAVLLDK